MKIAIYTDGGCHGNPGPGGWAYIIMNTKKVLAEKWGADMFTTNNRMELTAVTNAMEAIQELLPTLGKRPPDISVYTDSQYVQKGISEWIVLWKKNGWRNSERKPVKNKDLWQKLDALAASVSKLPIQWEWVRGHSGNAYNELCDNMTQVAINSLKRNAIADGE
ncbi:MAG: ribonuclease HI [Treponema sp.]|jgi:ribonuclease HI|nr:ribonuclease HI [Treponema sp.]